jgi:perosamine synthetase
MIPQIQPWIDEQEWFEVKRVMESTYLTENRATQDFEQGIATLTGAKHAIAVCNGTAALFCILKALAIGHGDEVIVPDMTFVATANAVIMAGARPIFAPIKKQTLDFDYDAIKSLITPNTRAIMPVHLYGRSADLAKVLSIATELNLHVIEDAAQAIGVHFERQHVGFLGVAGAISFYGNKTITSGEGGVILTDNEQLADTCRQLKNHGCKQRGTFIHEHIGFNFSMTEMQAAVGIAQLRKLPAIIERKHKIYAAYSSSLSQIRELEGLSIDPRCQPVHWFTSFYAAERDALADHLAACGIQTRLFFCPLHMQPCYQELTNSASMDYSESKDAYAQGISLPSSYGLSEEDLAYVIDKIQSFYLR